MNDFCAFVRSLAVGGRVRAALAAVLLLALAPPAGATTLVRAMSLEQVTAEAVRIVHATVTEVRSGRDASGLPATWVTFVIARSLKGGAGGRLTVKQYGSPTPLADGALARIAGMPSWAPGDEVVLFLRGDSARGFTSPVGLGQGVYRVQGAGAARTVQAEAPAAGARAATAPGVDTVPLDAFLARVDALVGTAR